MKGRSIRFRITVWYLGVLVLATFTLAGGGWWLLRRSVIDAADASLAARVDGVRNFIDTMGTTSTLDEMQDEFREYAQLTLGETLLEVRDHAGVVLCRPTIAGWDALRIDSAAPPQSRALTFADRASQGRPVRVVATQLLAHGRTYDVIAAVPMGPAGDAIVRFQWLLVALVPAVLALAAAGGYWISRRALAPVDRMTRAVQAITVQRLDRRLDVPAADDELRRLAITFNDMLGRLQASVADMVRLTADASHELRTPVSLVRATAEVALGRERSADEYRQALTDVLGHAERLSGLVGDLLALARADAGVEPTETGTVDLAQIAREAARGVHAVMDRASIRFDVDLPDAPLEVDGQPESLRRLITILLDNAVKYTPAGGAVRLSAGAVAKSGGRAAAAEVSVTDTGIGVATSERELVFDRFYRGAAARQLAADGSGLGLAIARTIAVRHGGTVALWAGADGGGCRAVVSLPLAAASAG